MFVKRLTGSALAAGVLALAGCGESAPATDPGAAESVSAPAPAPTATSKTSAAPSRTSAPAVPEVFRFTAMTLDGKTFDGTTLAAKPTVLWFWAPWCPKCRAQAKATATVASDYQGKVNVVGVAGLDKADAMRDFVTDQKVAGIPHLSDEAGTIWKRFSVTEQSTYVVLDAGGNKVFSGNLVAGDGLADQVAKLVG